MAECRPLKTRQRLGRPKVGLYHRKKKKLKKGRKTKTNRFQEEAVARLVVSNATGAEHSKKNTELWLVVHIYKRFKTFLLKFYDC